MNTQHTFNPPRPDACLSAQSPGFKALLACLQSGDSILARQSAAVPIEPRRTDRPWLFCESAGTSGAARLIRRSPTSWIRSFDLNGERFGLGASDIYATLGHLGHSLTLYAVLEGLHLGAGIADLSPLNPKGQARKLAEIGASVIYATPTQLRLLLAGAEAAGLAQIGSVRHIFSGGGKLDDLLRPRVAAMFPAAVLREFFGASETSFVAISDVATPAGSVGRPYPGVALRIGPPDQPVGPMQVGELWVDSPYVFDGYAAGKPGDTRWQGRWLSIGEMGYLDHDGYLFLKGRRNRMVTVADRNVFPEEIERQVMQMTGAGLCVALAQPDDRRGNRIICVVQGDGGAAMEKRLRQGLRDGLGAHAVPRRFVFLDRIPLLPAGKPDLQSLGRLLETRA
ncbi:AMP-binding protein [Sedimentitalea sp. HM32M-2]|uniref:AMP-binding protein n=1 Tax=Sedimentitalea sp. HM32M-2 TaxID=3351566 RepID=UPI003635A243